MNCKPGDLAYIRDDEFPENNGRIVEVIAPVRLEGFEGPGFWWLVRSVGVPLAFSQHGEEGFAGYDVEVHCRDCDLRPISGVPVHDEVTDEVTA